NSSSVTVIGTANDTNLGNVTVSLDNGTSQLATGTSNWTFVASNLTDGSHTIMVTAEDKAGNMANASATVTVSTSPPSTGNSTGGLPGPGSTIVQQGTIASNTGSQDVNATVLAPRSDGAVFTGTISYTAGTQVELYVLHAYGVGDNQTVNSTFSAPMT